MGRYKIYNKIYTKGRTTGRAFYSGTVRASSAPMAVKKGNAQNRTWMRSMRNYPGKPVARVVRVIRK